jgi:hypothetical protein
MNVMTHFPLEPKLRMCGHLYLVRLYDKMLRFWNDFAFALHSYTAYIWGDIR